MAMENYVDLFVEAIIAVALYGPLTDYITAINATGVVGTLFDLVPVLYVVLLIAAFAYQLKKKNK